MKIRVPGRVALLGILAVLLSGCSSATGIPALDRAPQHADQWPGDPAQLEELGIDVGTTRLLASHEGTKYYVATSKDQQTTCMFSFEEGSAQKDGSGGCGGSNGAERIIQVGTPTGNMLLVRDDVSSSDYESEGWQRIHENLFIGK